MSPAEAQARVTDVQTRMRAALEKAKNTAKQAADDARKATAYAALWLFITLLIGAFFASLSATWRPPPRPVIPPFHARRPAMKMILLWLLGVPIPLLILYAIFF